MESVASDRPDSFCFIIGAMKSGTTSLFEVLSQHPEICPSKVKEPDYFVQDRSEAEQSDYLNLWAWDKSQHRYALESSVAYTKYPGIPDVPKRMQQAQLGQYRFIYMLRHPIRRIESQVRHGVFAGWGQSLDEGIPQDAIEFSSYATQIEEYLKRFDASQLYVTTLEAFKNNPDQVLTDICRFLAIDPGFAFQDAGEVRNSGEFFNSSSTVARLSQNAFAQFAVQKLMPLRLKNWLRNMIASRSKAAEQPTESPRWQLNDDEIEKVKQQLAPELRKIEQEHQIPVQQVWKL